jgi:CHAT domain-containing protein
MGMSYWHYLVLVLGMAAWPAFGDESFDTFTKRAGTALQHGQYHLALEEIKSAQPLASMPGQRAQVLGMLGLTQYRMHHYQQADENLEAALNTKQGDNISRARWACALAVLKANQDKLDEARSLYAEALKLAGGNPELSLAVQLGQVQLLSSGQRLAELQQIAPRVASLTPPEVRTAYLVNIAAQSRKLDKPELQADGQKQTGNASLKLAYDSLSQAKKLANSQQPRQWAEISDGLAQLYEDENRIDEALNLNAEALQSARRVQADDLLLDLEWRQGRLLRAKKQFPEAIDAYGRAVDHIEAIRQDIPVEYADGRSSFRETLEPVYLGLADLLLLEANKQNSDQKTQSLKRARDAVELIKQSELADFLGGRCAVTSVRRTQLDTLASGTAVLYPIILPDRLELLVSIGTDVQHFSQPITATNLQGDIFSAAHSLRYGTDLAEGYARKFYDLLIAPIQSTLQQHRIDTLVWVPDGQLRLLSPAAFYDGKQYLIEKYTLVTSPGMTLFDSSATQQQDQKALLAGMSEPGSVLEHLPATWINNIAAHSTRGGAPKLPRSRALPVFSGADTVVTHDGVNDGHQERLTRSQERQQVLKKALSLPGVEQEMHTLQKGMANTLLMNETFTVDNFQQQLLQQPYSVVHIASHGVFGNSADTSFVMAYDNLITMDQLERLLKADKFIKQPVQLLTLSACQTAEGDDRAPLGFSGLAIKSKVRSALGTLWPVDDKAASQLMGEFYKNLSKTGVNKAQALQQAQLTLIRQKELNHPYYWSPFILVGNWL